MRVSIPGPRPPPPSSDIYSPKPLNPASDQELLGCIYQRGKKLSIRRYWTRTNTPSSSSSSGEEENKIGYYTNNMDPEFFRFVDRKYDFSILKRPVREKGTAHPDDLVEY